VGWPNDFTRRLATPDRAPIAIKEVCPVLSSGTWRDNCGLEDFLRPKQRDLLMQLDGLNGGLIYLYQLASVSVLPGENLKTGIVLD
jgi:hypothetical protein